MLILWPTNMKMSESCKHTRIVWHHARRNCTITQQLLRCSKAFAIVVSIAKTCMFQAGKICTHAITQAINVWHEEELQLLFAFLLHLLAFFLHHASIRLRPPISSAHGAHLLDMGEYEPSVWRYIISLLFCVCNCVHEHFEPSPGANYCTHASRKKGEWVVSVTLNLRKRASIFGPLKWLVYHSRILPIPFYTRRSAIVFMYSLNLRIVKIILHKHRERRVSRICGFQPV